MNRDRCEIYQKFKTIDGAYRAGDLVALRKALGGLQRSDGQDGIPARPVHGEMARG